MKLLVVDTQKGCYDERLYSFETVTRNIKQLIATARENDVEVLRADFHIFIGEKYG